MNTNLKNIILGIFFIGLFSFLISCETEEPWIDPQAGFEIWYTDTVTNNYVQVIDPYVLSTAISYEFVLTGEGESCVYWFGVPSTDKKEGSLFSDRGKNHNSYGEVADNGITSHKYSEIGDYTIVQVVSSYKYNEDKYIEAIDSIKVKVQ